MGVFGGTKDLLAGEDLGLGLFSIFASLIGTGEALRELVRGVDVPLTAPDK